MPFIETSTYQAKGAFKNTFFNTIYPAIIRKVEGVNYVRERLELEDGDFLDLDWSKVGSRKLVLVLHGLEGQADRAYVQGMVKHFNQNGWDGLGLNYRGCSGEPNRVLQSYHMGATADVKWLVEHLAAQDNYDELVLVGFSLGGNVTLRYIGENKGAYPSILKGAVAFSVPCDIQSANVEIHRWYNYLYLRRFLTSLNEKARLKAKQFPSQVQLPNRMPKTFYHFDDWFTGPIHGYKNGVDYYKRASSLPLLSTIDLPVLLVNAQDDTFLSSACYPVEIARKSEHFFFEMPKYGGHVGFSHFAGDRPYWSEKRAFDFIQNRVAKE